jgi:hypothetical protein
VVGAAFAGGPAQQTAETTTPVKELNIALDEEAAIEGALKSFLSTGNPMISLFTGLGAGLGKGSGFQEGQMTEMFSGTQEDIDAFAANAPSFTSIGQVPSAGDPYGYSTGFADQYSGDYVGSPGGYGAETGLLSSGGLFGGSPEGGGYGAEVGNALAGGGFFGGGGTTPIIGRGRKTKSRTAAGGGLSGAGGPMFRPTVGGLAVPGEKEDDYYKFTRSLF